MLNQSSERLSKEKQLFEKIYQFAKSKNETELRKIVNANVVALGFYLNGQSVIGLLAKEGDHESVNFLIDVFKGNRNHAARGYAQGGYIELVNEQLKHGASREYALWGYAESGRFKEVDLLLSEGTKPHFAFLGYASSGYVDQLNQLSALENYRDSAAKGYAYGGYVDEVNKQIAAGASRGNAICGYACAGRVKEVNDLLRVNPSKENREEALTGYAYGNFTEQMNTLIEAGTSRDMAALGYAYVGLIERVNEQIALGSSRSSAVKGYARCGYYDQVNEQIEAGASLSSAKESFLSVGFFDNVQEAQRVAAYIDNDELRCEMLTHTSEKNPLTNLDSLIKDSKIVNSIIKEYHLSFKEAKTLLINDVCKWLLTGPDFVKNNFFSKDIFFEIASHLMETSANVAKKILPVFHEKLFSDLSRKNLNQYNGRFFNSDKYQQDQQIIESRHQKRMKFDM